jgi:hypothetical protein
VLQEVEGQYKEGTLKHAMVAVLKAVQPEALSTQGIVDKAKELGIREFEEKDKKAIAQVRAGHSLVIVCMMQLAVVPAASCPDAAPACLGACLAFTASCCCTGHVARCIHCCCIPCPAEMLTPNTSACCHAPLAAAVLQLLASDANFLRMAKGAYSLHCLHPEAEQLVKAPQPKKRKMTDFAGGWGLHQWS